ncbi:FAD-binding oxidoreductase [Mesorhizobium sp. M8A.F.Ca.ET.208.01.1.1]|uniref:FAD-binding oxidoreductase n=1 Tax=unclassified Mesorhizobium TaxID=325217 RepID=UPI001093B4C6|nr:MULTISPECIES: FAD-binding oxidoreductase [unclassified Mesorhizobium]TGQ90879.1 FAD-binding oxidoreductase [Mesorhizobium sp. M8A.F.Ca.ET.208.01.1.1]TGT51221.1 FAD-binding oxidoreductase [Mesorhizobium sp. M8A.F.Ca.ET.167.01.1.1]
MTGLAPQGQTNWIDQAVPLSFVDALRDVVGASNVRTGEDTEAIDLGSNGANCGAGIVVAPLSTGEVAAVARICHQNGIAIVPQGGKTGLVGGSVSRPGEIVLSMTRMNRIERLDPVERVAVVDAGVTLEALQEAAREHRLEPGIDLAARGSATIGGMVSTNAGGVMAFRNGVMRHRVLGLEAVLADGSVYSDLTRVVKNSAGYDLKHLFIGAEGTLGIVTRVVVKLDPSPLASATALFGLPSVEAALRTIRLALESEAGHLRAAEAMWTSYFGLAAAAHGWSEPGVPLDQPLFLLLSLGGAREEALREDFERIYSEVMERYPEATGIIAGSRRQEDDLWRLREDTSVLYRAHPDAPSFDVSVPLSEIPAYLDRILPKLAAIEPGLAPYIFGHLADGNLHIILNRRGPLAPEIAEGVEGVLYQQLREIGGSFSAEHGVGSKRIHSLLATADPTKLAVMERVKRVLDDQSIMNPDKVLPRDAWFVRSSRPSHSGSFKNVSNLTDE